MTQLVHGTSVVQQSKEPERCNYTRPVGSQEEPNLELPCLHSHRCSGNYSACPWLHGVGRKVRSWDGSICDPDHFLLLSTVPNCCPFFEGLPTHQRIRREQPRRRHLSILRNVQSFSPNQDFPDDSLFHGRWSILFLAGCYIDQDR